MNFSDAPQTMTVPFPSSGTFREQVDANDRLTPSTASMSRRAFP